MHSQTFDSTLFFQSTPSDSRLFYIPYKDQHDILMEAQRILEECCCDFARQWFPSMLNKYWDCAQSVELTGWLES
jgi:hypothetical protein